MKHIQYNVVERDTKNASGKAKKDVDVILSRNGYKKLYKPSDKRWLRVIQQVIGILGLKKDTELFVQYPANIDFCYSVLKSKRDVRKIAIIHDIESLRGEKTKEREKSILEMFDVIISHNARMTAYLRKIGIRNKIINLNIFDYLLDDNAILSEDFNKDEIFFAGNLQKSKFLQKLDRIQTLTFNIFGASFKGIEVLKREENVNYKGSFGSEELISNLEGGWGLVWDGDNIQKCTGISGKYLKYNCPHKVSMTIASGRPVIIWNQAAMADYILEKGIGITVGSLESLPEVINNISDEQYHDMLINVEHERQRLIHGRTLEDVLNKISKQKR